MMQAAHDPALPPALQSLLAAYPLHGVRLKGGAGQIGLRQASPAAAVTAAVTATVTATVTAASAPPLPLVLLHGIGHLLLELQDKLKFACLFISHDLAVVDILSHRIAVMQHGRLVETGPRDQILKKDNIAFPKCRH